MSPFSESETTRVAIPASRSQRRNQSAPCATPSVPGRTDSVAAVVLMETPGGIVLMTREQLRTRVHNELAGLDLVTELLDERRRAAAQEDAA